MRRGHRTVAWGAVLIAVAACGSNDGVGAGTNDTGDTSGAETGPGTSDGETTSASSDGGTGEGPDLDAFFDPDLVQEFELEIAEADRQQMFDALPELIYVPATFRWRDVEVRNVGVRFKGNSSSDPNQSHKRGYLLEFAQFVDKQRFLDLRHLSLDNGVQFGSLFSERLVTDILRSRGILASRTNYCRLVVNGEYQGVYVNVERIDESFLEHHFADPSGPLYKVDESGPGAILEYLGDDPASYGTTFENKGDAVWDGVLTPLIELVRSLDQLQAGEVETWFYDTWEADPLIEGMAVYLLAGAFDQYTGWNPHNYYLYRDPSTSRWSYIPWDLDVGFADDAFGQIPVLSGWNAAYPWPVAPRPLLERFVSDPALLDEYRRRARDVLETDFHPDVIVPRLHALHALIEPHLVDDPFPHERSTNPGDTDYDGIVASIAAFMQARYDRAVAELDDPQETPPDPGDDGPPPPGPPTPTDPSDLVVVSATAAGVVLSWSDHSPDEGGFILQRCTGSGCTGFGPLLSVGTDVTTATDPTIASGQTYAYRVYALIPPEPRPTGPSNVVEATIP